MRKLIILRMCCAACVAAGMILLAGCEGAATLAKRQKIDRANMPLTAIDTEPVSSAPAPPTSAPASTEEASATSMPAATQSDEDQGGTYTFTIPPTITSVKETKGSMQQYRLFIGQPLADDKPFLVITVAPSQSAPTQTDDPNPAHRTYRLNGLLTEEWKGYEAQHHPYCELLVSRAGGDQLHAVAIARNNEQRSTALQILNTIKWVPAEGK